MNRLKTFLQRFIRGKRGIVTLWGIVFIAMAIYFICWFTVGLPLIYFIDAIRTQYTSLTGMGEAVIDTCIFAFEIHPAISLLGWFIYGIMHSAKKETDIYRYG